jgi:hypothetical protein
MRLTGRFSIVGLVVVILVASLALAAFYVDPIGLKEAEKSVQSPVQIDLEGVPLSATLRLALEQLGLRYDVRDGLLCITAESAVDTAPEVDYYVLLGHCVLALLAAGLGAALVPLVSRSTGANSDPPQRPADGPLKEAIR